MTERRDELWATVSERIAERQGFTYVPTALPRDDSLGLFELPMSIISGDRGLAYDILAGQWQGIDFIRFEYDVFPELQAGTAAAATWSCAVAQVSARFPRVAIRKTRFRERLGLLIRPVRGRSEQRRFDLAIRAIAEDRTFLRRLLLPETTRAWLLGPEADALTFEIDDCWVMCYAAQMAPRRRSKLVWAVKRFLECIPQPLLNEHRVTPGLLLPDLISSLRPAPLENLMPSLREPTWTPDSG